MQRLLEQYFKLDYEDVVGGVPTRFRWVLRPAGPRCAGMGVCAGGQAPPWLPPLLCCAARDSSLRRVPLLLILLP